MLHLGATGAPLVLSPCGAVLQFMRQSLGARVIRRTESLFLSLKSAMPIIWFTAGVRQGNDFEMIGILAIYEPKRKVS